MIIICIFIILIYGFLFIFSRKERIDKEWTNNNCTMVFLKMACFLYKKSIFLSKMKNKERSNIFYKRQVTEDLRSLNPAESEKLQETKFYLKKISMVLMVILIGNFIVICSSLSNPQSTSIWNGDYIKRNSYGKGSKEVTLIANIHDKKMDKEMDKEIEVIVNERKYNHDETLEVMKEIIRRLPENILGDNESLEFVKNDLNLIDSMKEFPVNITWESSDYSIINSEGHIEKNEIGLQGELILLTAVLTYFDEKIEHSFYIKVYPLVLSKEEQIKVELENMLLESDQTSQDSDIFPLPSKLFENEISWSEKRNDNSGILIIITFMTSIAIYMGKDRELHKKVMQRNKELVLDYPEMVSKLSLLMCSGMTIKAAWRKVAYDYKNGRSNDSKKRYLYEEMLLTCREMESGVSEIKAYTNFGKRCGEQRYLKFSSLISQNLKRGSAKLIAMLKEEAKEAFQERKNLAKRMGEEAGTKLLIPMMLMLLIVMIIIMVPAFLTFNI